MRQPSYNACLVEAELRARARYADPGRNYHGERHLDDCLARLGEVVEITERERRLLEWAILWHDAVHEPERSDNEQRSAELAQEELVACGVAGDDAREVARLILLTSDHRTGPGDRLGALMVSIDLAILGAAPDRYRAYADAVRREYAHVAEEQWRSGRAAVLELLLAREAIYRDESFRAALEAQARRNMQEELSRLRAD